MVIIMETRVEKLKRQKKEKRFKRLKSLLVILMIFSMFFGVIWVNFQAKQYDFLDNPVLFNLDLKKNQLTLLGEDYYLDFKIIKRQI